LVPDEILISAQGADAPRSRDGDDRWLIVGGGPHTGSDEAPARALRPLARFAPEHFDVVDIPYAWSTQPLRRRVRPQPGERRRLRRARDAI
jgi:hypothetical protein